MPILVRKINRSKWSDAPDDVFGVSSDAITSCLRSQNNSLSVWKIASEEDLDEVVLALVANFQRLETIDVVILDGEYLIRVNVEREECEGNTPISEVDAQHFDLVNLNYFKIGLVAEHIIERIKLNKVRRYTKVELKTLLKKAIELQRIGIEDLNESVAEALK